MDALRLAYIDRSAARTRQPALLKLLQAHPEASEQLELALKGK
jgi:hypothetical protein